MDITTLISTVGFPIAVTCYLLWERQQVTRRLENAIKQDLAQAIQDLKEEIIKFNAKCNGGKN